MKKGRLFLMGVASCGLAFTAIADSLDSRTVAEFEATPTGQSAPDVWVCSLPGAQYWGTANGIRAFSVATNSANAGNVNLNWIQGSTQHPVIAQNMYRLNSSGILEMVGMSWLKHGFCALQQGGCGTCTGGGGCLQVLFPGCSDPYSASLNGSQSGLGPRSQVNPSTGAFLWPHGVGTGPSAIRSRLQVADADILPAMNPGARWFIEGQYIHPQDAQANRDNNNASYREINIAGINFNGGGTSVGFLSNTFAMKATIEGWADMDSSVELSYVDVPKDGRFIVASRASENGDGTWHYEYAVFNMNSDRAANSFSVPVPAGVNVTKVGFHDVDYHSGEPYAGTDWPGVQSGNSVTWSTSSFASNPNANALRWSTMYNFRFDASAAPTKGNATLGLFKSGTPATMSAAVSVPRAVCIADLNGDGFVDGADLATLLANWGNPEMSLDGDGDVDGADLALLLAQWGDC